MNNWLLEDQDQGSPESGGASEHSDQSPGIEIIPEDDENDGSDDVHIESPSPSEDNDSNDREDTIDQSNDEGKNSQIRARHLLLRSG